MNHRSIAGTQNGKRTLLTSTTTLILMLLTAAFLAGMPARADEADDQYLRVFDLIQQADTLQAGGNAKAATAKYESARSGLLKLQKAYPDYQRKMVAYRLKYVSDKLAVSSPAAPSSTNAPTATNAPPNTNDTTAPATTAVPETQVKLLDAGAEPRKPLRLQPTEGDKRTLTISMEMNIQMKIGEMEVPASKLPLTKLVLDSTVRSVSAEGDIAYDMVMTDASVEEAPGAAPETLDAMKSSIVSMKGLSGKGIMSNRGIAKATEIKPPATATPQSRQAVEQMSETFSKISAPFPEEAIGLGARWEVKMPLRSQGMSLQQTTVYELASMEGDVLAVKSTATQTAQNQKIKNPAMPDLDINLMKMVGNATGELMLEVNHLLPSKGFVKYHSDTQMGVNVNGQVQTMDMKMDMDLTLEGK